MKDSFVIYTKIKEITDLMTDEQKGKLLQAMLDYEISDEMPEIDDPVVQMAFVPIRQDMDVNNEKWEKTCKARSEAGRLGGKAKQANATFAKNTEAKQANAIFAKQNVANQADNDNEYDNDTVSPTEIKEKSKKEKRTRFSPPTIEQVCEYCNERKNSVDPERFVNFYESKGWLVGKSPMKDWKAAVRNWEKGEVKATQNNKFKNFTERKYDMTALEDELLFKSMNKARGPD